jgi:hypothetical protein
MLQLKHILCRRNMCALQADAQRFPNTHFSYRIYLSDTSFRMCFRKCLRSAIRLHLLLLLRLRRRRRQLNA